MDSSKIKAIIVAIVVSLAALYLGINAATAQLETSLIVIGAATLGVCAALGTRIWMILPFMGALSLSFRYLPGKPDTLLLAQALFVGFSALLFLTRRLPWRLRIGELEIYILVLIVFVAQVYLRNPVGLNFLGSDTVGARSYAEFGASAVTAFVLCGLVTKAGELKWILRLTLIGWFLNFALFVAGNLIPSIGIHYGAITRWSEVNQTDSSQMRATRIGFLGRAGQNLATFVAAYISPVRSLLKPQWAILILISVAFTAFSGFRNDIAVMGLIYIMALLYHGGMPHLLIATLCLAMGLSGLAVLNSITPLPPNVQRSLSFLPGTWEKDILHDTENSSEWRFEMWEEVMLTDRWISNKWLGDGLGFTTRELRLQEQLQEMRRQGINTAGTSGFDMQRESILANGNYHSGPIQTIRTIGYFGLAVLLTAMIRLAVHAHRLIQRSKGTEHQALALLIGIPLIVSPIYFTLIYGEFGAATASTLIGIGMVRFISNSLDSARA